MFAAFDADGHLVYPDTHTGACFCPACRTELSPVTSPTGQPAYRHPDGIQCDYLACAGEMERAGCISAAYPPYARLLEVGEGWWASEGSRTGCEDLVSTLEKSFSGITSPGIISFQVSPETLVSDSRKYMMVSSPIPRMKSVTAEVDAAAVYASLESAAPAIISGVPLDDLFLAFPSGPAMLSYIETPATIRYDTIWRSLNVGIGRTLPDIAGLPEPEATQRLMSDRRVTRPLDDIIRFLEDNYWKLASNEALSTFRRLLTDSAKAPTRFAELLGLFG